MSIDNELNTKYLRKLPVVLTDKQLAKKGYDLNHHMNQKDQISGEMGAAVKGFKHRIEQQEVVISAIRKEMDTGKEEREIECIDIPNKAAGLIETHRLDLRRSHSDRIVTTRPMDLFAAATLTEEDQADGEALADAAGQLKKGGKRKSKAKLIKANPAPAEESHPRPPRTRSKKKGPASAAEASLVNGVDRSEDETEEEEAPMIADGEFEPNGDARSDYAH